MSRKTWRKGNLSITFGRPSITSHGDDDFKKVETMKDVMYFYYDVAILHGKKIMLEYDAYDFPKVQNLHLYIDEIMNFDMEKAYLLEDYWRGGFNRKVRYHQTILDDSFGFDIEYFYKIERYDYSIKQGTEEDYKNHTEYVLTIGRMETCKEFGGQNREEYGKCVMIKYLTNEDLLALKKITLDFCEEAIRVHNKLIEQWKEEAKENDKKALG